MSSARDAERAQIMEHFHAQAELHQRFATDARHLGDAMRGIVEEVQTVGAQAAAARAESERGAATIDALTTLVEELGTVGERLSGVVATVKAIADEAAAIEGIAFQSNILAINASIEASRAGEAGRGFKVVADAMRRLSSQSREAANRIADVLEQGTLEIHDITSSTRTLLARNGELVQRSAAHFDAIGGAVVEVASRVERVERDASGEQQVAEQLAERILTASEDQSSVVSRLIGELTGATIVELSAAEAAPRLAHFVVVDVRSKEEHEGELGCIAGARRWTLGEPLEGALRSCDPERPYLFVCRRGGRSARAARLAQSFGFTRLFNLTGGMEAWNEAGLPVERGPARQAAASSSSSIWSPLS